jgi:pimeloyl-ACP methyl ester carboxylesterase
MVISLEETFLETNGIRLHVVEAGPKDGKIIILLHGFPETWRCWKSQIEPLAEAGFRVIAPDQRGYNLSDKPHGVMAYHLEKSTADALGIILASGREKASVAGHDWGGIVAWQLAERYPQVVERLAILNAPHPGVVLPAALRDPSQFVRSLYVLFFQLPGLPEAILRNNDWALAVKYMLQATSRPGTFSEEDFEQYRQAWWQPGAFTAMLNWYRANFRRPASQSSKERIEIPTLILWGAQDTALGRKLAELSAARCKDARLVYLEEATHWLHHEEPEQVNRALIEFFQGKE